MDAIIMIAQCVGVSGLFLGTMGVPMFFIARSDRRMEDHLYSEADEAIHLNRKLDAEV